jgi:Rieske Fe-S protein
MTFSYPDEGETCLLLRPDDKTLVAYNQKCTHLSCAVIPELAQGCLSCPCHHGAFDPATGRPVAGPPRRPLTRITLEVREGTIYATGVELRTV